MGIIFQHAYDIRFRGTDGENIFLLVSVLMDTVDDPPFPVWSVDEPWLEETNTAGIGEYGDYSGGGVVVEEVSGE